MKNILKAIGVLVLALFFLAACSDYFGKSEHSSPGDIKGDHSGAGAYLSELGEKLKAEAKEAADQGVSRDNPVYKAFLELAKFNIPVPKMVVANTGSILGISHYLDDKTNKLLDAVVLDPVSGESISQCTKDANSVYKFDCPSNPSDESVKDSKAVEIAVENPDLLTALQASKYGNDKVLTGKVIVDGKTKDAKFVVTVEALYEGSQCTLVVLLGKAYLSCPAPVSRSKP